MRILFFGRLGDAIGREVEIDAPESGWTVAELRRVLAARYPDAEADLVRPSLRACVNDTVVGERFLIDSAAEVEFFPPLSGG